MNAMEFVAKFVKYYDNEGIADEYDKEADKMVTSRGVYNLVKDARSLMPKKIKPQEADARMQALSEADRDQAIKDAGRKVADLRHKFSKAVAANGGTRGILARITDAIEAGDDEAFAHAMTEAKVFTLAEREGDAVFADDR